MSGSRIAQDVALRFQLAMIAGSEADAYIEIRRELHGRYTPWFFSTQDLDQAAHALWERLQEPVGNTFVGACPRVTGRGSGANACGTGRDVSRAWCLWADCDSDEAIANLDQFEHQPTFIVGTGRGVQPYWRLTEPAPANLVKRANRRLAYHLGADAAATNPSRILRLVGSWSAKRGCRVVCSHFEQVAYRPGDLVNDLPDHPRDVPREKRNVSYRPDTPTVDRLAGPLRRLRGAAEGERNDLLFWAARCALEASCDDEEARALLTEAALAIGLSEREVAGTLASAWRGAA